MKCHWFFFAQTSCVANDSSFHQTDHWYNLYWLTRISRTLHKYTESQQKQRCGLSEALYHVDHLFLCAENSNPIKLLPLSKLGLKNIGEKIKKTKWKKKPQNKTNEKTSNQTKTNKTPKELSPVWFAINILFLVCTGVSKPLCH